MHRWFVLSMFMVLPAASGLAHQHGQKLPAWRPDGSVVQKLGAEFTVGHYGLRPPRGYTMQTRTHAARRIVAWTGTQRADGTRPGFSVIVVTQTPGSSAKLTIDDALKSYLASTQSDLRNSKHSAPEHGRINNLEFVRSFWNGTDAASGIPLSGFAYVFSDSKALYMLDGQDVGKYAVQTLALSGASALTFRDRSSSR